VKVNLVNGNLTSYLFIVSKIPRIIGPQFPVDSSCLSLMLSFGVNL